MECKVKIFIFLFLLFPIFNANAQAEKQNNNEIAKYQQCPEEFRNWYNKIVELYGAYGYKWPGTFKTCQIKEDIGYIGVISGKGVAKDVFVTIRVDPKRLEYNLGATKPLFCVVLNAETNMWDDAGKTCPQNIAQGSKNDSGRKYCAIVGGAPMPDGCGLTLSACQRVVAGLANSFCR
jgi:hypothetical protein